MTGQRRPALILASASPRRRELLERFWNPEHLSILVPDFDEKTAADLLTLPSAHELARILPAGKMAALKKQYPLPDPAVAIAADTMVVLDDHILGKPADPADAARMLRLLSGRQHEVLTGVCLSACCQGRWLDLQTVESTAVRFAALTEEQIQWYVSTGEPMDKAGAYGIQGCGAALIETISGCYYNVMGLPVHRLMVMLQQAADHFSSYSVFGHLLPWC